VAKERGDSGLKSLTGTKQFGVGSEPGNYLGLVLGTMPKIMGQARIEGASETEQKKGAKQTTQPKKKTVLED